MSYNKTTYDYLVFFYDINDLSPAIILKDLYAQKASGNTDDALSSQELDFIEPTIKEACSKVNQAMASYQSDFDNEAVYPDIYGVLGYEYGKMNIDPDNGSTGNIIVFRIYFRSTKLQLSMLDRIDTAIEKYIEKCVRHAWAVTNGLPNWQILQSEMIQALHELHEAVSFRKHPTRIASTYF